MTTSVVTQQNLLDYLSSIIYSTYSILGIILNSSLLWLTFTHKHSFIKEYRILLGNTTCTLLLHSLLTFFLQFVSAGDSLGFVALGPARFLDMPFLVLFCTALWLAIEYYAFMTIAMCMIYRYVTISGRSFSERQLLAFSAATFLLPLSMGIAILACNPDFSELHAIMDKLRPEYGLQRYGNYSGLPNVKNVYVAYTIAVICGIAIMSYIVMITVGFQTKKFLAEKAGVMSTRNLQMFKMMIKALIIQALVTVPLSFPHICLYLLLQFTSFRSLATLSTKKIWLRQ
ncbi:unnamed protein product [Cylicocyclus nassatus]|uniref:G protein-coupled receptor n=1 Tax=Cylicocyclus nassatus TaxID=53992 RepID=A0AA36M768_CYLNA|nr:unnamed protein product [Cylicocyclus nassatus]